MLFKAILLMGVLYIAGGCSVDRMEPPVIDDCQFMFDFEQQQDISYFDVVVGMWCYHDPDPNTDPLPWGNKMDYEDFAEYSRCK